MAVIALPSLKLDPTKIEGWRKAKKTKAIFANHPSNVFRDLAVIKHLKVRAYGGYDETFHIHKEHLLCNDLSNNLMWQEPMEELRKNYRISNISSDGWLVWEPFEQTEVLVKQVTKDDVRKAYVEDPFDRWGNFDDWLPETTEDHIYFHIDSPYTRDTMIDGTKQCLVKLGNWIVKRPEDPNNRWVVYNNFFQAFYEVSETLQESDNRQDPAVGN